MPVSQLLVAFTIEFDNAFERVAPHRTTLGAGSGPYLVSMAIWTMVLQHVDRGGITVRDFALRSGLPKAGVRQWLARCSKWWGYLTVHGDAVDWTPAGLRARDLWTPLNDEIERRWERRFGSDAIARLRSALQALIEHMDPALAETIPLLGYGQFVQTRASTALTPAVTLPAMLGRVVSAFALAFEPDSPVSLANAVNVLPVFGADPVRAADVPRAVRVSKEAVAAAVTVFTKAGIVQREPAGITLTARGIATLATARENITCIQARWAERFGAAALTELRAASRALFDARDGERPLLAAGLEPPPDGWRTLPRYKQMTAALLRDPHEWLPHVPAILHRGGWPDGS